MVLKNVENLSSSKISFVNLAYKNYVICKETMYASPRHRTKYKKVYDHDKISVVSIRQGSQRFAQLLVPSFSW